MWNTINLICSAPQQVAVRCRAEENLVEFTRTAIMLTVVCTAIFGLVLGSHRGVEQSVMAAIKLPSVWLLTLALCIPGFYSIAAAFDVSLRLRSLIALTLAATARASIVLFALSPALWLMTDMSTNTAQSYHRIMFAAVSIYVFAGAFGVVALVRAFSLGPRAWLAMVGFGIVFFAVAGQTAWSLRPFVGRPSQAEVPWLRVPEGTFVEAVLDTSRSARGIYREERH